MSQDESKDGITRRQLLQSGLVATALSLAPGAAQGTTDGPARGECAPKTAGGPHRCCLSEPASQPRRAGARPFDALRRAL